jgi:DNA repair protein RadC
MEQMSFIQVEGRSEYRPRVRDLPVRERPVNRLREVGPTAVSTIELLACLLQTPDALRQAQELLARFEGLDGLARACETEIVEVEGLGPAQAARIKAALEFGRRLVLAKQEERLVVRSPSDVAQMLMAEMSHLEQEHIRVLVLDTRNRVMTSLTVYIGSLNASHIRVAEVFREAVRRNAAAIIVAHNHPSGDPSPSPEDVRVTRHLVEAGSLFDIEVLDRAL